jgi:Ca2+-transporting ATPase
VYLLATTAFYASVVICQIGNAFACRTEKSNVHQMGWFSNPILLVATSFSLIILFATVYISSLAKLFDHTGLPSITWLGLGMFIPIVYALEKARKLWALFKAERKSKLNEGVLL